MSKTAVVIPARYASTRLPGKPLIKIEGKSIIQWVWEKSLKAQFADEVIIATDDERIAKEAETFGANVAMTSADHQSGSDRIAEVVKDREDIDIIVNVQGDEPLIDPKSIDLAIKALKNDDSADISTLIRIIEDEQETSNPNLVKVVKDNNDFAMYFSRAAIPYQRNLGQSDVFGHIGLYAYRRTALLKMTQMPQSSLEKSESLEQLRALQNGMKIKTVKVDYTPVGIDTPEDLEKFKKLIQKQ